VSKSVIRLYANARLALPMSHNCQSRRSNAAPVKSYRIVNIYPHDPKAFTQGLVFANDVLYESTGLRGKSSIRKVDLETGSILKIRNLPSRYFGEGITVFGNKVVQLTWKEKVGFVYDVETLQLHEIFNYPTDGWGITHDGKHLIMSDGTSTLYLLDPQTYKEVGRIQVHANNSPVLRLNELEYVKGEVYANVWRSDCIARISPRTGELLSWVNLEGILNQGDSKRRIAVLNGIAYDAINDRLFVTGKLWPKLFEIDIMLESK